MSEWAELFKRFDTIFQSCYFWERGVKKEAAEMKRYCLSQSLSSWMGSDRVLRYAIANGMSEAKAKAIMMDEESNNEREAVCHSC